MLTLNWSGYRTDSKRGLHVRNISKKKPCSMVAAVGGKPEIVVVKNFDFRLFSY